MKKIIAMTALLAVTAVNAEDLKFGDLNFFVRQGQFNLMADVNYVNDKSNRGAAPTTVVETEGFVAGSQLNYGITDRLNILAGVDYNLEVNTFNRTTNQQEFSSEGLGNPRLGLNYRITQQDSNHYNVDLGLISSFRMQDAEQGAFAAGDGNAVAGRSSMELNARMGRKWNEANEWQLAAGLIRNLDGELATMSVGADVKQDIDSSNDIFVRATYQYRPVNEFMMGLSVQGTKFGEFDSQNQGNAVSTSTTSHLDYDTIFTAKYLVCDSFITKFRFGQSLNDDFKVGTADIKRRRESVMGLGVDWLF